jgi:hypothetical protein
VLQELEEAIAKLITAKETIRLSKSQIKESLPKLKDMVTSAEDRTAIAKHLLETV